MGRTETLQLRPLTLHNWRLYDAVNDSKADNHFFSGDVTTPRAMECGNEQGGSTSSNRSSCLDDTGKMVSRLFLEVLNLKRHIKVDIPLNEAVRAAVRACGRACGRACVRPCMNITELCPQSAPPK